MDLVLIRHGQTEYGAADERAFIGHGRDLMPLSDLGVAQAEAAARAPELKGCQLILASPYTRAMHTAAIISRISGLKIRVEIDLREWQPDRSHLYDSSEDAWALRDAFDAHRGQHPPGPQPLWESTDEMIARIRPVLDRYLAQGYQRLCLVAHGMVIGRLTGLAKVDHCRPYVVRYREGFQWHGWVGSSALDQFEDGRGLR